MKKMKLIFATILCITILGLNFASNFDEGKNSSNINLSNLELIATANAEDWLAQNMENWEFQGCNMCWAQMLMCCELDLQTCK